MLLGPHRHPANAGALNYCRVIAMRTRSSGVIK
jgi:hypothetical protein